MFFNNNDKNSGFSPNNNVTSNQNATNSWNLGSQNNVNTDNLNGPSSMFAQQQQQNVGTNNLLGGMNNMNKEQSTFFGTNHSTPTNNQSPLSSSMNTLSNLNTTNNMFNNSQNNISHTHSSMPFNPNLFSSAQKDVFSGFTRSSSSGAQNNSTIFQKNTLGSSIALGSSSGTQNTGGGLFSKEQLEAAKGIFENSATLNALTNQVNKNKISFSEGFSSSGSSFAKNSINPFQKLAQQSLQQNEQKQGFMNSTNSFISNNNEQKTNNFGFFGMNTTTNKSNMTNTTNTHTFKQTGGFWGNANAETTKSNTMPSGFSNFAYVPFIKSTTAITSAATDALKNKSELGPGGFGSKSKLGSGGFGNKTEIGSSGFGNKGELGSGGFGSKIELGSSGFGNKTEIGSSGFGNKGELGSGGFGNKTEIGSSGFGNKGEFGSGGFGSKIELGSSGFGNKTEIGSSGFGNKGEFGSGGFGNKVELGSGNFENKTKIEVGSFEKSKSNLFSSNVENITQSSSFGSAFQNVSSHENMLGVHSDLLKSSSAGPFITKSKSDNKLLDTNIETKSVFEIKESKKATFPDDKDTTKNKETSEMEEIVKESSKGLQEKESSKKKEKEKEKTEKKKNKNNNKNKHALEETNENEIETERKEKLQESSFSFGVENEKSLSSSKNESFFVNIKSSEVFKPNKSFGSFELKPESTEEEKRTGKRMDNTEKELMDNNTNNNINNNDQKNETNVEEKKQEVQSLFALNSFEMKKESIASSVKEDTKETETKSMPSFDSKPMKAFTNFEMEKKTELNKEINEVKTKSNSLFDFTQTKQFSSLGENKTIESEQMEVDMLGKSKSSNLIFKSDKGSTITFLKDSETLLKSDDPSNIFNMKINVLTEEKADHKKEDTDKNKAESEKITSDLGFRTTIGECTRNKKDQENEETKYGSDEGKIQEKQKNDDEVASQCSSLFTEFKAVQKFNELFGSVNFFAKEDEQLEADGSSETDVKENHELGWSIVKSPFLQTTFEKDDAEPNEPEILKGGLISGLLCESVLGKDLGIKEHLKNPKDCSIQWKWPPIHERKKKVFLNNGESAINHESNTYIMSGEKEILSDEEDFLPTEFKGTLRQNKEDKTKETMETKETKETKEKETTILDQMNKERIGKEKEEKKIEKKRNLVESCIKKNEEFFKKSIDGEHVYKLFEKLSSFVCTKIDFMNHCADEMTSMHSALENYHKIFKLVRKDQELIDKKQNQIEDKLRIIKSEQEELLGILSELEEEASSCFLNVLTMHEKKIQEEEKKAKQREMERKEIMKRKKREEEQRRRKEEEEEEEEEGEYVMEDESKITENEEDYTDEEEPRKQTNQKRDNDEEIDEDFSMRITQKHINDMNNLTGDIQRIKTILKSEDNDDERNALMHFLKKSMEQEIDLENIKEKLSSLTVSLDKIKI